MVAWSVFPAARDGRAELSVVGESLVSAVVPVKMLNFYENVCLRCGQTVYQVDRVGPLKDFTFFHQGCFKCFICNTKLTLKTYFNNQHSNEDKEVYCISHVPKIGPGHLDGSAVGIRSALNVPKSFSYVNEQIRGGGKGGTFDAEALAIKQHLHSNHSARSSSENGGSHHFSDHQYGRFDASALHIAHALRATEIQRSYQRPKEKPLDSYLVTLPINPSCDFQIFFLLVCNETLTERDAGNRCQFR